jgi:hypothetical protein
MKQPVTWYSNPTNDLIRKLNENELEMFTADMQDAIDGVITDWKGI